MNTSLQWQKWPSPAARGYWTLEIWAVWLEKTSFWLGFILINLSWSSSNAQVCVYKFLVILSFSATQLSNSDRTIFHEVYFHLNTLIKLLANMLYSRQFFRLWIQYSLAQWVSSGVTRHTVALTFGFHSFLKAGSFSSTVNHSYRTLSPAGTPPSKRYISLPFPDFLTRLVDTRRV